MPKYPGGTSAGLKWRLGDHAMIDTPESNTFNLIPNVLGAGKVGSERSEIDVTAFGDDWEDTLAGIQSGVSLTLRLAFDPANAVHLQLKDEYDDPEITHSAFALEHVASGRIVAVPATILGFTEGSDDPKSDAYEAEVTIKIVNPGVQAIESS